MDTSLAVRWRFTFMNMFAFHNMLLTKMPVCCGATLQQSCWKWHCRTATQLWNIPNVSTYIYQTLVIMLITTLVHWQKHVCQCTTVAQLLQPMTAPRLTVNRSWSQMLQQSTTVMWSCSLGCISWRISYYHTPTLHRPRCAAGRNWRDSELGDMFHTASRCHNAAHFNIRRFAKVNAQRRYL